MIDDNVPTTAKMGKKFSRSNAIHVAELPNFGPRYKEAQVTELRQHNK